MFRSGLSALMLVSSGLSSGLGMGCGASELPPATHEHFRAIQRHEGTLDLVQTPALEGECAEACEASARGCGASARICSIAESTSDVDARLRCRAAGDRCEQFEAAVARCDCP